MTPKYSRFGVFFAVALAAGFLGTAHATSGLLGQFNSRYGTSGTVLDTCSVCHSSVPSLNPYGKDLHSAGDNFAAIENMDSDGDGWTNIQEIKALTFPGDPTSHPAGTPAPPDTTPPVVTAFSRPATSSTFTVPILTFTATDDVAVTGYMVTTASTAPSATASGWTATPPTSHTFSASGSQTLWAWAKDAAGNVSAGVSATTDITATNPPPGGGGGGGTDTQPPVVTSFTVPASSASRKVQVLTFKATDDGTVTGYMITASSRTPRAHSSRWHSTPPASYKFRSEVRGKVTLYGWARDAAGNISAPAKATTDIKVSGDDDGDNDDVSSGDDGGSGGEHSGSGDNSGSSSEDDVGTTPSRPGDQSGPNGGPGTGPDSHMDIWVSRWFNVSIQNPVGEIGSTDGYLKILSWNADAGIMQARLFTKSGATGAWQSVDLELNVSGSPLHFLASFDHAGEFAFAASVIGTGNVGNLQSASLRAVGVSHSQHLAVMNGTGAGAQVTMTGKLVPESQVPSQILH